MSFEVLKSALQLWSSSVHRCGGSCQTARRAGPSPGAPTQVWNNLAFPEAERGEPSPQLSLADSRVRSRSWRVLDSLRRLTCPLKPLLLGIAIWGCFRWCCARGMEVGMCSVEQQRGWGDAPGSCTMAPRCSSLVHRPGDLGEAIFLGGRTPGQPRRRLEAVLPEGAACSQRVWQYLPNFCFFSFTLACVVPTPREAPEA